MGALGARDKSRTAFGGPRPRPSSHPSLRVPAPASAP
eukprot:CAMPEP_0177599610 /NCGR_PEP_ID=MMETSP0419_2-20121207/13095_1 /TAXON_ID=582737 /ORGANISM="Tetraselmis sp., Strain GSL018" /LENGTH=36 /DNA_ID= /DNA_START= /DNA_END= /DNA_ORIENTATION=